MIAESPQEDEMGVRIEAGNGNVNINIELYISRDAVDVIGRRFSDPSVMVQLQNQEL